MNDHPSKGYNIEDAFIVDEDNWITLPGNQGRISPEGVVYDKDGEPMYSIYEDSEAPLNIYLDEGEDYEWI